MSHSKVLLAQGIGQPIGTVLRVVQGIGQPIGTVLRVVLGLGTSSVCVTGSHHPRVGRADDAMHPHNRRPLGYPLKGIIYFWDPLKGIIYFWYPLKDIIYFWYPCKGIIYFW